VIMTSRTSFVCVCECVCACVCVITSSLKRAVRDDVITNTSFQRGCLSCAKVCLGCKNVFCMFRVNICFFPRYVHVSCKHEHIFSFLDMKHICLYLFFPRYDIFSFLDMKHICCMFTQKRKRKDMFMFTQKHIFSFLDMKHIFAKTCFACFV